ncbi:MAG TPA: hypothetical protein VN253_11720 [Kofleriaceae bacterium]|nr:hypothetical protein [Kofleriaceae bacterium]
MTESESSCAEIERCITRLVQEAPAIDGTVVAELIERLRGIGAPLALSIARVVELVAEGRIAPGISLPHLAMSCATLTGGVAGRLPPRALEAARYEIETLLPVPDVPLAALKRRP